MNRLPFVATVACLGGYGRRTNRRLKGCTVLHVELVKHDLGEARMIGGLVCRRGPRTYLIVDQTASPQTIIELGQELLTDEELTCLRNRRTCDLTRPASAA